MQARYSSKIIMHAELFVDLNALNGYLLYFNSLLKSLYISPIIDRILYTR